MRLTEEGWLASEKDEPKVVKIPGARQRTTLLEGGQPKGIVWHWTAGPCRNPDTAKYLAQSITTYNRIKDRPASWHLIVAKDGTLWQSYELYVGTWHVGQPGRIGPAPERDPETKQWRYASEGRLSANVNRNTIGVELENAGELLKVDGRFYCWPYWVDPKQPSAGPNPRWEIPTERAVQHEGKWFDGYTAAQVESAVAFTHLMASAFKVPREAAGYGHVMFDAQRKQDPGPLWLDVALPEVLQQVFGKR